MKSTVEHAMAAKKSPTIPLPKSWTRHVRTAMLHVISLAQYAPAYTRSWAADSTNARMRIKAEYDRAQQEILLIREEMRIKDARMGLISPHRRPYYPPTERTAILETVDKRGFRADMLKYNADGSPSSVSISPRIVTKDNSVDGHREVEPGNFHPNCFTSCAVKHSLISYLRRIPHELETHTRGISRRGLKGLPLCRPLFEASANRRTDRSATCGRLGVGGYEEAWLGQL